MSRKKRSEPSSRRSKKTDGPAPKPRSGRSRRELYKIPAAPSKLSTTEEEAGQFAEAIGYPVVMKIASPDIMHKTDVGGVKVGLKTKEEVLAAFRSIMENSVKAVPDAKIYGVEVQKMMPKGDEIIIGMAKDPTFGPMIAFGSGGVLVNLLKDASFRLAKRPPVPRFRR